MPLPMNPPQAQWIDANGHPYAGGSVETYVPDTSTPKDTFADHEGAALNTNPIVLDAAGRAPFFGSGDYRIIVRDADGNLVYDGWTSSIVSDAMQPVVAAETIDEAKALLGIVDSTAALNAEITRAQAAEANLQSQITTEVNRATAAEADLRADLDAEIARALAAEAALQSQIEVMPGIKTGTNFTDSSGHQRINYTEAFGTATQAVSVTHLGSDLAAQWFTVTMDAAGFDVWCSIPLADMTVHPSTSSFCWIAYGS